MDKRPFPAPPVVTTAEDQEPIGYSEDSKLIQYIKGLRKPGQGKIKDPLLNKQITVPEFPANVIRRADKKELAYLTRRMN